jgi:ABC-type oligopeptide transport system ATPase subunit
VAFVGPSGSGKSTVLNLVLRFYDQRTGSVTIDGVDVRQVSQESPRARMGVVFQDSPLFNDGLYARLWRKEGGFSVSEDGSEARVSVKRLRDCPPFSTLSETELSDLADLLHTVHYPAETVVAVQGKTEEHFYIIVRGKVKVERGFVYRS